FQATAGHSFTGNVANFADSYAAAPASEFAATITWGDGGSSNGTIIANGNGTFAVSGTHTYSGQGPYNFSVQINDDGGDTAGAGIAIRTSSGGSGGGGGGGGASALSGTGMTTPVTLGQVLSGPLAQFYGGTLNVTTGYTPTIYWGDGTSSTGQF